MANPPSALPQGTWPWILSKLVPSQVFLNYMASLDALSRLLAAGKIGPLTAVASPSNANAATAGVAIGQLYTSTANPAIVYIRTA